MKIYFNVIISVDTIFGNMTTKTKLTCRQLKKAIKKGQILKIDNYEIQS